MSDRTRSYQPRPEHPDSPLLEPDDAMVPDAAEDSVNREGDADIASEEAFDEEQEAYEDSSFEDEEE